MWWLRTGPFPPEMRMDLTCSIVLLSRLEDATVGVKPRCKAALGDGARCCPGIGLLGGHPWRLCNHHQGGERDLCRDRLQKHKSAYACPWGRAGSFTPPAHRGQPLPGAGVAQELLPARNTGQICSSPGRGWHVMDLGRFSPFWMTNRVAAAATARCLPGPWSRPIQLPAAPSTAEDLQRDPY